MANEEKTDTFQDFSLGLNTLTAPNRLDPKATPTHSNIWNDDGANQKKPGQLKTSTNGNGDTIFGRLWFGQYAHTSVFSSAQQAILSVLASVNRSLLISVSAAAPTSRNIMNTGGTGTASSAVASPTITGVGTDWNTTARSGAFFTIGNTMGIISTVDSDTQLTLTGNFGALNVGTSYIITNSWALTSRVSFVDMNSRCWICGPGSTTVSWNGTTQVFVDAFPKANYSLTYKNYVFAANTAANPSRVSWCSLKDPTTWPATNFVDVNPDDGFPIVGLAYDGQSIIIFKTNTAWKLTGDIFDPANPTYTLTQIYTPNDFVINSPKTFQLYGPNGYIMLGKKGFYAYNGGGAISKILDYDRIRGEFATIASFDWGAVPTPTAEPSAIVVDGNYWLQVPYTLSTISASDKELTYVLDKAGNVWRWQSLAGGVLGDFTYLNSTLYGVNSLYGVAGGTPGLIQLNTGVLNQSGTSGTDVAMNGTTTTKIFEYSNQQRFGVLYVYFKKQSAGNLTFEVSVDEGSFVSNTIDMTAGTGTRVKSAPIVVGRIGRSIQFRWSNNTAGQTFEVYAVELYRQELRR